MANYMLKKLAKRAVAIFNPIEGYEEQPSVDADNNTWTVIAGGQGGTNSPVVTTSTSSGATTDPAVINNVNYFTMLDNQLRDIKKILALMAIYQGVELPDEIAGIFEDDVAA